MKVLDIYPNHCWSFEAESFASICRLRSAAALSDEQARASAFEQIPTGQSFRLVGDAVSFDLSEGLFDEITVNYAPTVLKRVILHQRVRRWLKPTGKAHFSREEPVLVEEPYVPLASRIFRLGLKRFAPPQAIQ